MPPQNPVTPPANPDQSVPPQPQQQAQPFAQQPAAFGAAPNQSFAAMSAPNMTPGMQPGPAQMGAPMQLNQAYGHDRLAVISLVLGVVSLPASILNLLTIPIPIVAIVLGVLGYKKNKKLATAGIVLAVIGAILSVYIFSVGLNIVNNRTKTADPNLSGEVTGVKGNQLDSDCYTFTMPEEFGASDITKNVDCSSVLITSDSTEDVVVNSVASTFAADSPQIDEYLESVGAQSEAALGGKGIVTDRTFISLDGARAYKISGTQNYLKYKYFTMIIVVSEKSYNTDGAGEVSAFVIGADSATSPSTLDKVVESWKWK